MTVPIAVYLVGLAIGLANGPIVGCLADLAIAPVSGHNRRSEFRWPARKDESTASASR